MEYHARFPQWNFDRNLGEPTAEHKKMIRDQKGGTPVHRRSFDPMRRYVAVDSMTRDSGRVRRRKRSSRYINALSKNVSK